jgi:hypothetical protein
MNANCPDIEALLAAEMNGSGPELEHARTCAACSAVLVADRELGRSLSRIRDPLPPAGFVSDVMSRLDAQAAAARRMRMQVVAVFGVVVAGFAAAFAIAGPVNVLTQAMTTVRDWVAVTTAVRVIADTARPLVSHWSMPLVAGQVALAALMALGIRRLMPEPSQKAVG